MPFDRRLAASSMFVREKVKGAWCFGALVRMGRFKGGVVRKLTKGLGRNMISEGNSVCHVEGYFQHFRFW